MQLVDLGLVERALELTSRRAFAREVEQHSGGARDAQRLVLDDVAFFQRPRPVHHDASDPVRRPRGDHVRPAGRLRHPPVRAGGPVTQRAPRPGGEQRGAVPSAQQAWPMPYRVDALEDWDEPAGLDASVDLIVTETESP